MEAPEEETLLFLRRLRCIELLWPGEGGAVAGVRLTRLPDEEGAEGSGLVRARVLREELCGGTLAAPATAGRALCEFALLRLRLLVRGQTTELTLAFDAAPSPERRPRPLFAWLPVCHAGLPFALNADFSLVASRQAP